MVNSASPYELLCCEVLLKSKLTYVSASTVGEEARLASILGCLIFPFSCFWWYFENIKIKSFAGKLFAKFSFLDSNINLIGQFTMLPVRSQGHN